MKIETSETSPIRIIKITPTSDKSNGWVAITLAPGKKTQGEKNYWDRDLEMDLNRFKELGTMVFVPFLEHEEMKFLGIPDLIVSAKSRFEVLWFPFPDRSIPENVGITINFVNEIKNRYLHGQKIVMHCNGGLGRAGTIGACVRLALGVDPSPEGAISSIRKLRGKRAIEYKIQEKFINDFFTTWNDKFK